MRANFLRLRELMQSEFPGQWNGIVGENYPAPEWASYAGTAISAIQLFVMALILMGDGVWTYVPGMQRPPQFYYKMKENPALAFILVFLVLPSYVQSFVNTGAFEVYVDQKLIFSKLETGRMPNVHEIFRALEDAGLSRGS